MRLRGDSNAKGKLMQDFNGVELAENDTVIYATLHGSGSTRMRKGTVTKVHPNGLISIRPTHGPNGQEYTRTITIDTRTGRVVDPFKHLEHDSHYINKDTGERIPDNIAYLGSWHKDHIPSNKKEWVQMKFKDYLQEVIIPGGTVSVIHNGGRVIKI